MFCSAGAVAAQDAPFTGPYAGVEAGLIDHHYWLTVTDLSNGEIISDRYYREKDLGGGVFAG